MTKRFTPEVVIVGSGASGSMAAYILARAGVKTLMLEAGRDYDPSQTPMFDTMREAPLCGSSTEDKPFGYYDATINGGWQVPGEPYTEAEGTSFRWWRTRMLGGRTNHWGRHVPRFGPYDFKGRSRDGLGVDWPISYEEIAPYYDRVEALMGVSGAANGLENHPDSPPGILHDMAPPRITEMIVEAACADLGIPCVPTRQAILTRDMPDPVAPRQACFNATECGRGCSIGAAFQTPTSLLPMAKATGNLQILTGATATRVRTDAAGKATGVEYVSGGKRQFAPGRAVILAASSCETARLLLNSRSDSAPRGLANSSGQVGRNLADTVGADIAGRIPALAGRPRYNEDGMWVPHRYIPFWLYKEQAAGKLDFARSYHLEFAGRFFDPGLAFDGSGEGYGAPLKQQLYDSYGTRMFFAARGEMIPNDDCYCELDPKVTDKFGMPALRFHWKWGQQEEKLAEHAIATASRIIERLGGTVEEPEKPIAQRMNPGGGIIHEVGTARMGSDPRTSVVDAHGHAWDVPNLVLVDGAIFASSPHKNPTLTMMALSIRNTEHLIAKMKRGEL